MAGLIPQSFIDEVLDRTDIVDIISSRVQLKKAGKNYSACCPFHEEKTPSFTVTQEKQFYHCFGCGASGNAIGFLMEYERLEFIEAIEYLAKNAGLEVPKTTPSSSRIEKKQRNLYSILIESDKFFRTQLRQHPEAKSAITYLKKRGLSGKIAAKFGIGFAPNSWDLLLNTLSGDENQKLLEQSGMLISKPEEKKLYDRFRNKIMFPIRDQRGRTVGFGGRVLDDSKPKYINSPETPIFQKGRELFGLYEARKSLKAIPNIIMVEGYLDVISLSQFEIHNAVASLGTSLTENHLHKIFRYTPEIIFCFDGDDAGRKAAARALETCLPQMRDGFSAKFIFLPESEDPDSMIRKMGKEKFLDFLKTAIPLSDYFFDHYSSEIDTSTMDGKARLGKVCAVPLSKIPKGIFRQLMLSELSKLTNISEEQLQGILKQHSSRAPMHFEAHKSGESNQSEAIENRNNPVNMYSKKRKITLSPGKQLTALIINHPSLVNLVDDLEVLAKSDDDDIKLFLKLYNLLKKNPDYKASNVFSYWSSLDENQSELETLKYLAASELYHPPAGTGRDDDKEFMEAVDHVIQSTFTSLPIIDQAKVLVSINQLNEQQVKRLHKIHVLLPDNDETSELKGVVKQRLVQLTQEDSNGNNK